MRSRNNVLVHACLTSVLYKVKLTNIYQRLLKSVYLLPCKISLRFIISISRDEFIYCLATFVVWDKQSLFNN